MPGVSEKIRPALKAMVQPTFADSKAGDRRSGPERDDTAAVKTYRYLRLGMIVIVIGLLSSILIQHHNSSCWQDSISAYYYTPARPVFVGGLLAIGICLIVIKGSTPIEDALLNLAGALAPVVAFVPTNFEAACNVRGQAPTSYPFDDVRNNIGAYLIAGLAAFLVAVAVFVLEQVRTDENATRHVTIQVVLLVAGGLLLAVGGWALATDRIFDWHGWSATVMFGVLAVASVFDGCWLLVTKCDEGDDVSPHWRAYGWLYVAVGTSMIVLGVIIKFLWPDPWAHRVLVLELVEIALFGMMWLVQSFERWGKVLQTPSAP